MHGTFRSRRQGAVPARDIQAACDEQERGQINGEYRHVVIDSYSRQAWLLTYAELAGEQNKEELQEQLKQSAKLELQARHEFIGRLADSLHRYGLKNQAYRLVEELFDEVTAARTKHALVQLDLVDPSWRDYAGIRIRPRMGGVQIISNRGAHYPATTSPYRASIIFDHGSERSEFSLSGLYEISPVFGGKNLVELNLYDDYAIEYIGLRKALDIAQAVRARDEAKFKETVACAISSRK